MKGSKKGGKVPPKAKQNESSKALPRTGVLRSVRGSRGRPTDAGGAMKEVKGVVQVLPEGEEVAPEEWFRDDRTENAVAAEDLLIGLVLFAIVGFFAVGCLCQQRTRP